MIGVIVPLLGGMGCYLVFDNNPSDKMNMLKAAFIGVVLTATSVSITVETLREMGKLKSRSAQQYWARPLSTIFWVSSF